MTTSEADAQGADRRNVVLTGFMGTGKSTVGRGLAERLGFEFVDTDQVIESRHGPIEQIFATAGESRFREHERAVASELSDRNGLVVSTGGKLMLDSTNAELLGRNGRVFCLVATPDEILERVANDSSPTERPLLGGTDPRRRIAQLLEERAAGYGLFSQVVTSERSPEAVVDELAAILRSVAETEPSSIDRVRTALRRLVQRSGSS